MEGEIGMTNLEKMNELVRSDADKEQIKNWAYMNRIHVVDLHLVKQFEQMEDSVDHFISQGKYDLEDELNAWDLFLESKYK